MMGNNVDGDNLALACMYGLGMEMVVDAKKDSCD